MNTNETLNGKTAGFIATIANSLSRSISEERMKELIACPRKMALLLTPLIDDSNVSIMPSIFRWVSFCEVPRLNNIITFDPGSTIASSHPTLRMIMREAYERKYAPLHFTTAKKLFDLLEEDDEALYSGLFPFFDNENKLWLVGKYVNILVTEELLDKIDYDVLRRPFFFAHGCSDRSDCFKC